MEAFENSTTNGTAFGNVTQDIFQKENNLLDLVDNDMNITKLSTIAPTTNDFIETPSPIEEEEETNANNWTEQPHQTYNDNQQFMAEEEEEALEKPQNEIDFMTSNLVEHMKTDESDMSEVSNRIFVDDFGPETDVDGGDDGALKSPMEHEVLEEEEEEDEDGVVVEECNNEEVDFAGHEEPQMMTGNNPFSLENKIIEELSMQNGDFLKETNPFGNVDHHHLMDPTAPIIDNKIIDELESYGTNSVAEKAIDDNEVECASDFETIEPEHTKKQEIIDFSEKRDFSFEKELTMDTTAEEIHDFVKHEIGSGEEDFDSMQPEEKIDQAATTLVEESAGEDSEDEWNYIKVKEQEQQKQQEAIAASETNHIESVESEKVESEKIESELEGGDNVKESEFVEEKQPQELFEHEAENIQEEGICLEEEIKEEEAGRLEREEIKEEQEKVEELVTEEDHFDENKENIFEPVEQIERAIEVPVFESVRPVEPEPIIEESPIEPYTDEVEEKIEQEEVKFETELHFEPEAVEEEEDEEDIEEVQSHPHKEELVEEEIKEQESVKEEEDQIEESDDQPNSLENQMASQLNPEAKEFVPISPIRSDPTSPINTMAPVNPQLNLPDDSVISQSPRKGASATLDIANLPSENEFDIEISKRPHELEEPEKVNGENGHSRSSSSGPSFQEMNLKEAMHGDEKLEYEYNDEKQVPAEDLSPDGSSNTHLLEQLNREEDPMNRSFYAGRDENILSGDDSELNKVQDLPDDIIADEEEDHQVTQQNGGGDYFNDEISKPEEDMYSPVTEQPKVEEFLVTTESDKPESELLLQEEVVAPIVEAASHVASEITTLINEIQIAEKPAEIMECNLAPIMDQMSQFFEKAPEMPETELAGSLPEAENLVSREITEESAESDKCLQNDNLIDVDDQLKESVPECDVPPPTPAVVTGESFSHPVIMPELSESPIREDVESPVTATPVDEPVIVPEHIETVAIEQKKDEIEEKKVEEIVQQTVEIVPEVVAVAAATVAAATVAAVAATTKKPAAKPTDKKPATGKTVPAKPASAPVKTASKTVAAAPPKKTSAPVTKAAPAKPASPPKPISKPSTTSTTAAKPKPAVTAPTRPAVERKPLTSTLAAKKPADIKKPSSADAKKPALAVNGEAKKPIANGDAKSPIVKKTAPLKTTVAPTKTAPAKPAVPKPAVSATKTMTVTKTSSVSKSPITKPATARVPSSTTTSTVTAKTSTARAPLSSVTKTEVKPRVTTSTTNKAPTSATARMSVTNTTAPKTTLAVKKTMSTDTKTSPTSKTVSKTSTTTVKSSTVGAARTTTTTTKTSTNVIKKSASPIKKPSAGTAKPMGPITRPVDKSKTPSKEPVEATTTLTNGHSENGHLENHETNEQKMNHLNLEHDSNLLIDTSDPPQQQMIVIDSAAD